MASSMGKLSFADQPVAQGLALDERHHIVEQAVGFTGIDEAEDVRMLELGGEPDLALEALAPHGDRQLGMQDFDGHVAVVTYVPRQEDGRHASPAKLPLNLVPVGQQITQPGQCVQDGSTVHAAPIGQVCLRIYSAPALPGIATRFPIGSSREILKPVSRCGRIVSDRMTPPSPCWS